MKDKISEQRAFLLHPRIQAEIKVIIELCESLLPGNIAIRIVQGLRTIGEQNDIYAQGRTKPGKIVTKAKGGMSYHNYGLAIDIAFIIDRDGNGTFEELEWGARQDFNKNGITDWKELVTIFKKYGYVWGADWDNDGLTKGDGDKDEHLVDAPHLQKNFGFKVSTLFNRFLNKDFISNTEYVNI